MFCKYCAKQVGDGAKFCSYCGKALIKPKIKIKKCRACGIEYSYDRMFCEQCGQALVEEEKEVQEEQEKKREEQPKQPPAPQEQIPKVEPDKINEQTENPKLLKTIKAMSLYTGEPKISFSKATGTLNIYNDRLEFVKKLGNSAGAAMFGIVGAVVAANKAKKDGDVNTYYYKDLQAVRRGTYGGMLPGIVITLNSGEIYSFFGNAMGATIDESIKIIGHYSKEVKG